MNNIVLRNSIYILMGISSVIWFGLAWGKGLDLSKAQDFFGLMPKVVSIDLLVIAIFAKWGWKIPLFRGWLVPFPDLNGTWTGNIHSDWVNQETKEKVPPIPVMLTINQNFSHISCLMHTSEMKSYSIAEGFTVTPEKQIKQLSYIYTSKPRVSVSQRSLPHDGSIIFDIIESPKRKLIGKYWTDRKTTGEIILEFYKQDILEELPSELCDHPVTEPENRH